MSKQPPIPPNQPDLIPSKYLDKSPSDEVFRLLVTNVKDYSIFMLDPEGYVVSWNAGAQRSTGYTEGEIRGKHFSIFYSRESRAAGHPNNELALAKAEGRYEEDGWRVRKDGSKFWANVVITPIYEEGGELVGFAKITRDLTERKRAELEQTLAAQSQEPFRLLVSAVKDYAIFILDADGRIMTWNEGAQRAKGYTAEEIIGQHFSVFYTKEANDIGHPQNELKLAIANGRYEEEGWRIRKDGSMFWANVVITPIYQQDNLIGFAKITRDLTERKRAEEQREKVTKVLYQMNEELQRLAYVVSHELQAPISTILRYTNLLKVRYSDALGNDAHDFIDKVNGSSQLIARMIDDLWTYARLTKPIERQQQTYMVYALNDAILELGDLPETEISHGELPTLNGHRDHFVFLFKELIGNAVRYRGDETPKVEITAEPEDNGWVFAVNDNGIGIDPVRQKEVFGLFQRLHGGPEPSGTGMGLAICKKIVEQYKGRIWFESEEGQGTTFYFWLPTLGATESEIVFPN